MALEAVAAAHRGADWVGRSRAAAAHAPAVGRHRPSSRAMPRCRPDRLQGLTTTSRAGARFLIRLSRPPTAIRLRRSPRTTWASMPYRSSGGSGLRLAGAAAGADIAGATSAPAGGCCRSRRCAPCGRSRRVTRWPTRTPRASCILCDIKRSELSLATGAGGVVAAGRLRPAAPSWHDHDGRQHRCSTATGWTLAPTCSCRRDQPAVRREIDEAAVRVPPSSASMRVPRRSSAATCCRC
ncbi:MAG: hypothetical protein MZW92_17915 [Comamonadaceae bacterium]|nr:hypothetical protein [Comamonadaceae bacterium]